MLEDRRMLSGLTIVTHGHASDADGWVAAMGNDIARRVSETYGYDPNDHSQNVAQYTLRVTENWFGGVGELPSFSDLVERGSDSDVEYDEAPTREVVLKVDWSDLCTWGDSAADAAWKAAPWVASASGHQHLATVISTVETIIEAMGVEVGATSTVAVGAAVAGFLLDSTELVAMPIHTIGHSRGASVNTVVAQALGAAGIWIDQFTTLDPHPVDGILGGDIVNYHDAPMNVWRNVVYADNYWREDSILNPHNLADFDGEAVEGAYSKKLDFGIPEDVDIIGHPLEEGYTFEHSDTHLWYHGTIDTDGPVTNGDFANFDPDAAGWYGGNNFESRDEIGYYFSRAVGGPRRLVGLSEDIGQGTGAREQIPDLTNDEWPSLVELQVDPSDFVVSIGEFINVDFFWHDHDSSATLSLYLDQDQNPYNHNEYAIGSDRILASTAEDVLLPGTHQAYVPDVPTDKNYHLLGKISDGTRTRHTYAPGQIEINDSPGLTNPRVTPTAGSDTTEFSFRVDYSDVNGDAPSRARVLIDGIGHFMSLESGSAANGTYAYTTTLPRGTHSHLFSFEDGNGGWDVTDLQNGPTVVGPSETSLWFYKNGYGGVPVTDDFEIRYSIDGGDQIVIPGSSLAFPGVTHVVSTPSVLHLEGWTNSVNHEFGEWGIYRDGPPAYESTNWTLDVNIGGYEEVTVQSYWDYTPQYYALSGHVLADGAAIEGTTVMLTGLGYSEEYLVGANGTYAFSGVPGGVPYTITAEHPDYTFAPPSYEIPNLMESGTTFDFLGISSDSTPPEAVFVQVPPVYVDDRTQVTFQWSGTDDMTAVAGLEYSYRLLGAADESWSAWSTTTETEYDLPNGVYTFDVKVRDEGHNESTVSLSHTFALSAVPRVSVSTLSEDQIWVTLLEVSAPVGATTISDTVVIYPEQFGLVGDQFLPVRLYDATGTNVLGTIEYAVEELAVPAVFEEQDFGFVLTLPSSLNAGESAQYVVQWGQLVHMGWQDNTDIPTPNTWNEPHVSVSHVLDSHVDSNGLLWQLRSERENMVYGRSATTNSSLWLEVFNPADGTTVNRRIEYAPADWYTQTDPEDPADIKYCGTWRQFISGDLVEVNGKLWVFWETREGEFRKWDPSISRSAKALAFQRFDRSTLEPLGNPIYSEFVEDDSYRGMSSSHNGEMWVVGNTDDHLFYSRISSTGTALADRVPFANHPGGLIEPSFDEVFDPLIGQDGRVWSFYSRSWNASPTNDHTRMQLYVTIFNPDGSVFLAETPLLPAPADPSLNRFDGRFFSCEPLLDNDGKAWISLTTNDSTQLNYYYSVFNPDGSVFKEQIPTDAGRAFHFIDSDGYIWASEADQRFLLTADDSLAHAEWSVGMLTPTQSFGLRAVQLASDYYQVFDRWSAQSVRVDVPTGLDVETLQVIDVDKFGQGARAEDLVVAKEGTTLGSISGQIPAVSEIDVSGQMASGQTHTLEFSQAGLLGGEIIATFPGGVGGRIIGTKWSDLDGDGVKDDGEPGLSGWKIYVDENNDGQWNGATDEPHYAVTGADGTYVITDVPAGTHTVAEVQQTGWVQTHPSSSATTTSLAFPSGTNVSGTIPDKNGNGTGFTDRLPGTGADYTGNDPNLDSSANPGSLAITSTRADLGTDPVANPEALEAYGLLLPNVGDQDVTIKALFRDIQVYGSYSSNQLTLYAGQSATQNVRAGIHYYHDHDYALWSRNPSDGVTQAWTTPSDASWSDGDDVELTLSRQDGRWQLKWHNLTNDNSGTSDSFSLPWVDGNDLYVGIHYANANSPTSRTSLVESFAVEVGSEANHDAGNLTDGLVAYYPFNGDANDESGSNHGTVHGATLMPDRLGNDNSAYSFDGNDYIQVADHDSLDVSQEITISAWVNPSDVSSIRMIVSKYRDGIGNERSYLLELKDGKPHLVAGGSVLGNTALSTDVWHHVAGVYDGSHSRIYVDGVLDVENAVSGTIPVTSQSLNIGRQAENGRWPFLGKMDEVRIYDRALSADEVRVLYDGDGTNAGAAWSVTVTSGKAVEDINFGNRQQQGSQTGEIRGVKWKDEDADGVRDEGEVGLEGWTVFLDENHNGELDATETSTTTDSNGNYTFPDLNPGIYTVAEVVQAGWEQTYPIPDNLQEIAPSASVVFEGYKSGEDTPAPGGAVLSQADISDGNPWASGHAYRYLDGWNHNPRVPADQYDGVGETEWTAGGHAGHGTAIDGLNLFDSSHPEWYVFDFSGYEYDHATFDTNSGAPGYGHEYRWYDGTGQSWTLWDIRNAASPVEMATGTLGLLHLDIDYGLQDQDPDIHGSGILTVTNDGSALYNELMARWGSSQLQLTLVSEDPPIQSENPTASPEDAWAIFGAEMTISPVRPDAHTVIVDTGEIEENINFGNRTGSGPVIIVGNHSLLPDTANQVISITVAGTTAVTGMNVRAQIGDGTGSQAEPIFTDMDFTGGIWDAYPNTVTGGPVENAEQLLQASVVLSNTGDEVAANGVVMKLVVDTTGFTEGEFDLRLSDTEIGVDSAFILEGGGDLVPAITNGTIKISPTAVVNRRFFYNNSYFDGDNPAANASDDNAIATDKTGLLPGQTATFANYTSYSKGVNGLMFDIRGLANPGAVSAASFEFKVGNTDTPASWTAAPAPVSVTVREDVALAGVDRVTIIWADDAIRKQWLEVTVRADAAVGLASPDVSYFGNAVGESGNSATNTFVDGSDFAGARDNQHNFLNRAPIHDAYDYNRDSFVDGSDLAIARDNNTNFLTALKLLNLSAGVPGGEGESSRSQAGEGEASSAFSAAFLDVLVVDQRPNLVTGQETPVGVDTRSRSVDIVFGDFDTDDSVSSNKHSALAEPRGTVDARDLDDVVEELLARLMDDGFEPDLRI